MTIEVTEEQMKLIALAVKTASKHLFFETEKLRNDLEDFLTGEKADELTDDIERNVGFMKKFAVLECSLNLNDYYDIY